MSKNSQIPGWKVVLTDKIKDYSDGNAGTVIIYTTDADRSAVYQALRYLPGYAKVSTASVFNGGVWLKFEGKTWSDQRRNAMALVTDLELVQEEVEAIRDAQADDKPEPTYQSGQFVNTQTETPKVPEAEQPTTTVTIQETIKKIDAKTLLFAGLIIAAIILIIKK